MEACLLIHEINLGATAIGTGINAPAGYAALVCARLADITGVKLVVVVELAVWLLGFRMPGLVIYPAILYASFHWGMWAGLGAAVLGMVREAVVAASFSRFAVRTRTIAIAVSAARSPGSGVSPSSGPIPDEPASVAWGGQPRNDRGS